MGRLEIQEVTHDGDGYGKAYNPNCMCERCHSIWELLVKAGDNITINGWVEDTNGISK